jgi:hypothetical protein
VRKWIARSLTITFATLAGCGHTTVGPAPTGTPPTAPAASVGGHGQIFVSADIGPPEIIALWSVYGLALADAAQKAGHDDFAGEVRARTVLADRWKESRTTARVHDPYLDTLADVRDAGFMSEYVLAFLTRQGWTVTGGDLSKLNITGFTTWAAQHLPRSHEAVTRVKIQLGAPARPTPIPGANLIAAGEVDPHHKSCAELRPLIDRAMDDWDRETKTLAALPLSVSARTQILPSLEVLARDPRARREGVVFASSAVIEIIFDAGFCAVDRGGWSDGERLLRQAIAIAPMSAKAHSELVQALIMQQKLDEADAELERAIAVSDSVCQTAILWRKRGYILFERREMVEAYRAYAKSLELDPQSALAHSEMQVITKLLHQAGSYDEKLLGQAMGPPGATVGSGKMTVANCPE